MSHLFGNLCYHMGIICEMEGCLGRGRGNAPRGGGMSGYRCTEKYRIFKLDMISLQLLGNRCSLIMLCRTHLIIYQNRTPC